MALFKEITINNKKATYHKVASVMLTSDVLQCHIESHIAKEYRDIGCGPVGSRCFNFSYTLEEEESMGIRALCYKKIKELEEWQGAEDC